MKFTPKEYDKYQGRINSYLYRETVDSFIEKYGVPALLNLKTPFERKIKGFVFNTPKKQNKRELLKNKIILGTYGWRYDPKIIKGAISKGIWAIDTAETYGLGRTIKALSSTISELKRIRIIYKYPKNRTNLKTIENSFRRAKILFPDQNILFSSHWPNRKLEKSDFLSAFTSTSFFGVSNFSADLFESVIDSVNSKPFFLNQINLSFFHPLPLKYTVPWFLERKITVLAYSPLGQNYQKKLNENRKEKEFLEKKAKSLGCTIPQLLLSWLLNKNVIPIFRTNTESHLIENMEALSLVLEKKDEEEMDAVSNVKVSETTI